jgi:hypothetical protein
MMMISTKTSIIRFIVLTFLLFSIVIFAANESGKNYNDNSDGNSFQLLKISYNDIQEKSSRQNVIDVLKSSLSREGNDYNYIYILFNLHCFILKLCNLL